MSKIANREGGIRRKTVLRKISEHLEEEQGRSNADMIRRMRAAYFADVDALEKSGSVKIPD